MNGKIIVKNAREHNLKNVTVEIPKQKLVVFTGISGSGKSSLAMDTIYAEGQRRYVESLSSYARQFLGVMDKPDVDYIEGLSPSIAIDQKRVSHNPRSTVGTITEIYDYLRVLFARVGHPHCPNCGQEISHLSTQQIVDQIFTLGKSANKKTGFRLFVLSPIVRDRKGEFQQLFESLQKKGYTRVRIDGHYRNLDDDFVLLKTNKHSIDVVVDRLVLPSSNKAAEVRSRLHDSIETALRLSDGNVIIAEIKDSSFELPKDPKVTKDHLFSERFACPSCNLSLPEIEPRTFSFNSPHGACPACTGLGVLLKVDPLLVISPSLSIAEGGILPFSRVTTNDSWFLRLLEVVAQTHEFSLAVPLSSLSQRALHILLYGTDDQWYKVMGSNRYGRQASYTTRYEGIIPTLERRYKETESEHSRAEIERYMREERCSLCEGTRLKKEALSITIGGESIVDVTELSIKETLLFFETLSLSDKEKEIAQQVLKEIKERLSFLVSVGLDYLSLSRRSSTLAGGEAQRIRLASQVGSGLSGVLYVLDEPSIGLHQRDNKRLIDTLKRLRDLGNTVIVVEHDREIMEQADHIVDFGPGAGDHGGYIVSQGSPDHIRNDPNSITGQYLSGKKNVRIFPSRTKEPNGALTIIGATEHNLKNIMVKVPLRQFVCVTGVSGSGKSTLVHDILYKALAFDLYKAKDRPGKHQAIQGVEDVDKVLLIDQSPIGRTPRSNPATYTGVFTAIRELFSQTQEARMRGYKLGRFSFNVKGGRCENCQGEGQIKIEMHFLPDVYVDCEVCKGKRYNSEALEVLYKGKNISEVLDMTVYEALEFFTHIPSIEKKLSILQAVGLGYIRLGQPAPTLSGGEAQRVKLSSELSKKPTGNTLYILDEPTTGLHFADIEKLLRILRQLVDSGNSVIVIEHNLDVIKNADWIIDLGPEGGDNGGKVIAQGTPEEIAKKEHSYTGQFLRTILHD
ncbi:MAG TPA: excinuclease ABC subunit UvrA [Patescibacteria group bacterium]|nr:excinuclease ABC subunit UvrA [Patescibacteria group bacterium]